MVGPCHKFRQEFALILLDVVGKGIRSHRDRAVIPAVETGDRNVVNQTIKNLIVGTPLEGPARSVVRMFTRTDQSEWRERTQRDEKSIDLLLRRILKNDSNCVDVGAHKGSFLENFVQLAPMGTHYAFEPLPELAQALKQKFPTVDVFNCALSDRAGTAAFYHVPEMEAWSGLKKQDYPKQITPQEVAVALGRLDDVLPKGVRIDFIKIDVEGAELEVFKGAIATIKRCKPTILFEHAKIHNKDYGTTSDMVYDVLVDECELTIWDLGLASAFSRGEFRRVYENSFASNYGKTAQTNFVAGVDFASLEGGV